MSYGGYFATRGKMTPAETFNVLWNQSNKNPANVDALRTLAVEIANSEKLDKRANYLRKNTQGLASNLKEGRQPSDWNLFVQKAYKQDGFKGTLEQLGEAYRKATGKEKKEKKAKGRFRPVF